jgi:hypothetical protein
VPPTVPVAEASDAGQKCIEHLTGVMLGCSSQEAELRKELVELLPRRDDPAARPLALRGQIRAAESYSEPKAEALFQRFARNGTWQCPTLTVLRALAHLDDKPFTADPRVKYVPPFIKSYLYPKQPPGTPEEFAHRRQQFKKYLRIVGAMRRAKVEFLAGTDEPNPYCFAGFSLHDELALLVEAGLTPLEALQAATYNPAKYLGKLESFGTVARGKRADLVLLDANPLDDIQNTRRLAAVVSQGKLLPRERLQAMLAEVEAQFQPKP